MHQFRIAPFLAEIVVVTALFAAAGSWPVPDTNEPHYLAKARHFENPGWCEGDFFLESPEAHHLFYRVVGPIASALPLEQAAWVCRWAGWLALAIGIECVLTAVVDSQAGFSPWRIVAAAIWSLGTRHLAASGEWVIGGCEAKVFAWAFALAAAGMIARGRPATAWLLSGLGTSIHAIVGGWSMAASAAAAVAMHAFRHDDPDAAVRPPSAASMRAVLIAAGLGAAAVGVVPALRLSAGVAGEDAAIAVRTYVVERLPHHLLFASFADGMVARHVLAVVLCLAMMLGVRRSTAIERLAWFVAAAVALALTGCVLSLLEGVEPTLAYGILRFYWFRLSDGLVPLLLGAVATLFIRQRVAAWPTLAPWQRRLTGLLTSVVAATLLVDLALESRHWPLPWRPSPVSRADRHVQPAAWEDVCRWARDTTPKGSRFITPRGSASFQWRAERPEVVAWKHVPQSFAAILEWRRRLLDCFSADAKTSLRTLERSITVFGADRIREVARRYEADYVIVPIDRTLPPDALPFERVYANAAYEVFRIRQDSP